MPLKFEWDSAKAKTNLKRHGISFLEAATAFGDPLGLRIDDPDHSDSEDRFVLLGLSASTRLLVVVYCERATDQIRIISARKARRSEWAQYQQAARDRL